MKTRKLLSVLLALVMVLAMLPAGVVTAYADTVASGTDGNITWTLDDAGTLTISGQGAMRDYISPEAGGERDTYAPWLISDLIHRIQTVVIRPGVTSIGNYAFWDCSALTNVTIPDSVTSIGSEAFYGCSSLTGVTIPQGVTSIGQSAFNGCSSLTSVTIPGSVTSIGNLAFFCCSALTSVTIPQGVTSIGQSAFNGCSALTSVTIPDSVTSIGESAFYGCSSLTGVTIPDSVTSIGDYAFQSCALRSVDIPESVTSIGSYAFFSCGTLGTVRIEGAPSIGAGAFDIAQVLIFSGHAPTFAARALSGGSKVACYPRNDGTWTEDVRQNWGGTVTWKPYTPGRSFAVAEGVLGDDGLWELDGEGVLTLDGSGALDERPWASVCRAVRSVVFDGDFTSIGGSAFAYCSSLTDVTIPDSVTSIGNYAFSGCSSLTGMTIPDGVTSIGESAFYGCSALTSVTIPDSVTSIYWRAFRDCSALTSLTIGDSVTSIGESAFSGCSSLTSVTIPDSVTSIGASAFSGCSSLTGVTIPDSVTRIGGSAFSGCKALKSVTIGTGVASIGTDAFSGCTALETVTSASDIPESLFQALPTLRTVTLLPGVESVGASAFQDCAALERATLPEGLTTVGTYAFAGTGLTSVLLPDSLTKVPAAAFKDCLSLATVMLPETLTSVGAKAFSGCDALANVYYGGTAEQWAAVTISSGNEPLTNATIHYATPLAIAFQPQNFVGLLGDTASFTVEALGAGLKYRWQVNDGSGWKNSSSPGAKTETLKAGKITETRLAYRYRCVITDTHGNAVTSNEVHMVLMTPLQIVRQPEDFEGILGTSATFTVAAQGDGLKYQWQVNDGSGWKNSSATGSKTATLKAGKVTEARLACLYRCLISDQYESTVTSDEVRMILVTPLQIVQQPTDFDGALGTSATFTVAAQGDGLKYQWQVNDGSGWKNSSATGNKTATLKAGKITEARLACLYRCLISDRYESTVTSDEVRMILVTPLQIVQQPTDYEGYLGFDSVFTVIAKGDGLKYQWQVNDGSGWKNSGATGNKTETLKAGKITQARLSYLYRCVIKDQYGHSVTSNEVRMALAPTLAITHQPVDFVGKLGDTAYFTVAAQGIGLTYQWQVNSGSGWKNSGATGNKTARLKAGSITEARLSCFYRCVITDTRGNTVTSDEVRMELASTPLTITRQPQNFTGSLGDTATFTVAAEGDGLTYQWQVNNGSGWANSGASGNKTARLKAGVITEARLTCLYRCIITDEHGDTVTTKEVRMMLPAASGTDGNIAWMLDNDGTLTISGEGEMRSYSYFFPDENDPGENDFGRTDAPWGEYAGQIQAVVIQPGVTTIGHSAFYGCHALTSVSIPAGVMTIGDHSFAWCTALTTVVIPEGVTSIGSQAFVDSGLTSVFIPDSVIDIGDLAFMDCSLKEVSIPRGVTSISDGVFAWTMLTEVTIPAGVISIGEGAFQGCSSLTSVTIPASVTVIGNSAFSSGCSSLTDVYYGGTEAQWAQISISSGNGPLTGAAIHYNTPQ